RACLGEGACDLRGDGREPLRGAVVRGDARTSSAAPPAPALARQRTAVTCSGPTARRPAPRRAALHATARHGTSLRATARLRPPACTAAVPPAPRTALPLPAAPPPRAAPRRSACHRPPRHVAARHCPPPSTPADPFGPARPGATGRGWWAPPPVSSLEDSMT